MVRDAGAGARHGQLERLALHRACVQISSELTPACQETEQQHFATFASAIVAKHPDELTRALVWRVMTSTAASYDRLGAWRLLHAAMVFGAENADAVRVGFTDRLTLFLPSLIRARWLRADRLEEDATTSLARAAAAMRQAGDGADDDATTKGSGASGANGTRGAIDGSFTVLKPNADGTFADVTPAEIAAGYVALLRCWLSLFAKPLARDVKCAVDEVERGENRIGAKVFAILDVPLEFDDSLWKLRRRSPRPSTALEVFRFWGGKGRFPANEAELDALAPMHPRVREWMRKLTLHRGGDIFTDMWRWTNEASPCSRRHLAGLRLLSKERAVAVLTSLGYSPRTQSLDELVRRLVDDIARAIALEQPFEELLQLLDSLRGRLSTPRQRRALFIHASYHVDPSHTGLRMRSATDVPPAVRRAETFFDAHHRHKEKRRFLESVQTIHEAFQVREVQLGHKRALEDIKAQKSFLFCLLDPQFPFASVDASPCPAAVEKAAEILPRISTARSLRLLTEGEEDDDEELWDYYVASEVLSKHGFLGCKFSAEESRINEAIAALPAGWERRELEVAVGLVLRRHVPFCQRLRMYGPRIREKSARAALEREQLSTIEVRLRPNAVRARIEAYRRQDGSNSERARDLEEALRIVTSLGAASGGSSSSGGLGSGSSDGGTGPFPPEYGAALDTFEALRVPLATVQYAPDAVERMARQSGRFYLVAHIDVVTRRAFPRVCFFCSRFTHTTEEHTGGLLSDLDRAHTHALLAVLRQEGVTLGELCNALTPKALALRSRLESHREQGLSSNVLSGWDVVQKTIAGLRRGLQSHPLLAAPSGPGGHHGAAFATSAAPRPRIANIVDDASAVAAAAAAGGAVDPDASGLDGVPAAPESIGPVGAEYSPMTPTGVYGADAEQRRGAAEFSGREGAGEAAMLKVARGREVAIEVDGQDELPRKQVRV